MKVFAGRPSIRFPHLGRALRMLAGLLLLVAATSVAVGQGLEQDAERLERERQIEAKTAQLRTLHTQGRYEEVVAVAKELLVLDPENLSARVWLDRARVKIEQVGSTFPGVGTALPGGDAVPPDPFAAPSDVTPIATPAVTPEPTPEVVALPDFTPAPLAPRKKEGLADKLLSPWVLIIAGIVAVLLILLSIFAIWRMKSSQRQLQQAIEDEERRRKAGGDVHDAVTQYSVFDAPTDQHSSPAADDDSVMQFGEVGTSRDASDEDTMNFAHGAMEEPEEQEPVQQHSSQDAAEDTGGLLAIPLSAPRDEEPEEQPAPANDEVISLGSFSEPEEPAEEDKSFGSFNFSPEEETRVSPSAPAPDADISYNSLMFSGADETIPASAPSKGEDKESFTNVMFGGAEETVAPGGSKPAAGAPADADVTYNSLMFSGADETQLPGAAPAKPAPPIDDAQTYNSLMFSGADETMVTGGAPPAPAGDADTAILGDSGLEKALGETISLDEGLGDLGGDETIRLDPNDLK